VYAPTRVEIIVPLSELYSHLHEELAEAERVGFGFDLPKGVIAPNAPKISNTKSEVQIAA
jgi:hypothetical protein